MALFRRGPQRPTVPGRAVVVPGMTFNVGGEDSEGGNYNNLSAGARVKSVTVVVARSAADGAPVSDARTRVECELANWLRFVLHDAGCGRGQHEHLPTELEVPVLIDAELRTVVAIDDRAAEVELASLREIGKREWKETEAPLAPVRFALSAPGKLRRALPSVAKELRDVVSEIRTIGATDGPLTADALEEQRRHAEQLRTELEGNPVRRDNIRKNVLDKAPQLARETASGKQNRHGFEAWLMYNETSGVLTADEAAELRTAAGLGG